jgi:hypothetical protein
VRRVAACGPSPELAVGASGRGRERRAAIDPGKDCSGDWAGIECSLAPPLQVSGCNVVGVEPAEFDEARGNALRHLDRSAVVVPCGEAEQHAAHTVLDPANVSHRDARYRSAARRVREGAPADLEYVPPGAR